MRRLIMAIGLFAPASGAYALSQGEIFGEASLEVRGLVVALVVGMIAAVAITIRKALPTAKVAGGSAFVSALRAGGPLIGLLGAVINVLGWCIAMANMPVPPTLQVMAPGFAEAVFLLMMGIMAGIVGVICHWVIEARIDRSVLRL